MDWDRIAVVAMILGGLVTALSPIVQSFIAAVTGAKSTKASVETEKEKTSLDGFNKLTDQLQEQLDKQEKRIAHLEAEIRRKDAEYEEHIRLQSAEFHKKERGYQEAINGLTDKINEQARKIRQLEKATAELKQRGDTGPLPAASQQ